MNKCKNTNGILSFCSCMQDQIEEDDKFTHISIDQTREGVLLDGYLILNFCPLCGGKLMEEVVE